MASQQNEQVTDIPKSGTCKRGTAAGSTGSIASLLKYEKLGPGGIHEKLGAFNRVSTITVFLVITIMFVALSAYYLIRTTNEDLKWQQILDGKRPFPNISSANTRTRPYFEGTKIQATPLGRMLKAREDWRVNKVNFGLARKTKYSYPVVIILLVVLGCCILHVCLVCVLERFRRKFQMISLGYGFVGVLLLTLCLTTLYYSFVHKLSCYLENARVPPNSTSRKDTLLFINLTLACAFAYSKPNVFVKVYPLNDSSIRRGASFTVDNQTYLWTDLMELGICPRQDLILVDLLIMAVTTGMCWFVSSFSETLENKIIGPPVWMQRFKVKTHKGIRHWQTRSVLPTYIQRTTTSRGSSEGDEHGFDSWDRKVSVGSDELQLKVPSANLDDAYDILDGGLDHILLSAVPEELHSPTGVHHSIVSLGQDERPR